MIFVRTHYQNLRLALLLVCAFGVCACSQTVSVSHSPLEGEGSEDDYATKVLVLAAPDHLQKQEVHSGLFAVGLLNTWQLDINENLAEAVADVLSKHYQEVVVVKDHNGQCADCGLVVRPRLVNLQVNKISMQSSVELELKFYDGHGRIITSLTSKGSSPFISVARASMLTAGYFVPFVGSIFGEHVVQGTLEKALDKALLDTSEKIAQETYRGKLARTWRPKKTEFGAHEYAAELVARRQGCDLRTDGIMLEKRYFTQETYKAYCWGQAAFHITCEYGKCQADAAPHIASQQDPSLAPN